MQGKKSERNRIWQGEELYSLLTTGNTFPALQEVGVLGKGGRRRGQRGKDC